MRSVKRARRASTLRPPAGLDNKKPDRLATSFQLISRQTLPAGEYAVYMAGTHNGELVGNFFAGNEYFTFGVAGPVASMK